MKLMDATFTLSAGQTHDIVMKLTNLGGPPISVRVLVESEGGACQVITPPYELLPATTEAGIKGLRGIARLAGGE